MPTSTVSLPVQLCVTHSFGEGGEDEGKGEKEEQGTGGKGREGRSTYVPKIWTLRLESSKELKSRSPGFARLQARPCPALNEFVKMTFFDEMQLRTVCCWQGGALECSVNVNGKARGKLLCVQVRCQIGPLGYSACSSDGLDLTLLGNEQGRISTNLRDPVLHCQSLSI